MARLIEMPKLSPTMEEGQIVLWHKREGESVEVDELLAEVETDKATMEFRSFDRGTLLKVLAPPGSLVKLGDPVAIIGNAGEPFDTLLASPGAGPTRMGAPGPESPGPASAAAGGIAGARDDTFGAPITLSGEGAAPRAPRAAGRTLASPFVRKQAREHGIDLGTVSGSGPSGRIVARDLPLGALGGRVPATRPSAPKTLPPQAAGAAPATVPTAPAAPATPATPAARAPRPEAPSEATIKPLSMMRRTIARRLTESKRDVPHFYLTIDVDAGALFDMRQHLNRDLAPRKVSFNDLVIKAVAIAIGRAPEINAQFMGDSIAFHARVDLSIAVAIDDGLVTPVLRGADRKSLLELGDEIAILAERARARTLRTEEMTGGTFSISNLGMYGLDEFAAVINPPEGAILAVGALRSEPVVVDGAVVPGKRMKLTLSCDHRVVDGAVGAKFLAELRQVLERPLQIAAL